MYLDLVDVSTCLPKLNKGFTVPNTFKIVEQGIGWAEHGAQTHTIFTKIGNFPIQWNKKYFFFTLFLLNEFWFSSGISIHLPHTSRNASNLEQEIEVLGKKELNYSFKRAMMNNSVSWIIKYRVFQRLVASSGLYWSSYSNLMLCSRILWRIA